MWRSFQTIYLFVLIGLFLGNPAALAQSNKAICTKNPLPPYPETGLALESCAVEINKNSLYASWRAFFGKQVIEEYGSPYVHFSIRGPGIPSELVKKLPGKKGLYEVKKILLLSDIQPGTYGVTIHLEASSHKDGETKQKESTYYPLTVRR